MRKVQIKRTVVQENVNDLHCRTAKVLPKTDVKFITDGRNSLSNEKDSRFSKVADRLSIVEPNPDLAFTPAVAPHVPKRCRELAKKARICRTPTQSSQSIHSFQALKRRPGSVVETCIADETRQRILTGRMVLDNLGSRS